MRLTRPGSARLTRPRSWPHIIGVSVSDTMAEATMAADQGDAEFAKQPADDVGHEQDRHETSDQRQRDRGDGKAHLPRSLERGVDRPLALSG